MNYAKKVLKGTVSVFVISMIAALLGYLARLVMARGLTQEDYGTFYAVFSMIALLAMFRDFGINQAIVKFIPEYLHKKKYSVVKSIMATALSIQFFFSALIGGVIFIFSEQIAVHFFSAPSASLVIRFLALMFILMPFEHIFLYSFQGFQKMFYFSMVELLRISVILAMLLVFFQKGMGLMAPSLAYFLVYIIVPVLCIPFFIKMFPQFFKSKITFTYKLADKLIRFGLPITIGLFGFLMMTYTDTIILSYFRTMDEVALYQVASPTARMVLYLGYAIAGVFLPLSAELWAKGKKEKLRAGMELLYRYSFIAVIPMALLMMMYPELILKILFGAEYISAATVMQILAIGTIFYTIGHLNGNVLSGIGMPKENTKAVLIAAVFNLVANIIFIPHFGMIGAAVSTFISWLIILGFTSYKVKKHIKAHAPWWGWIKNFTAGAVFVLVIYLFKSWLDINIWAEMIISIGVASVVYCGLVLLFKLITKEDLNFLMYAIRKK